jgi:hypothetical protein
MCTHCDKWFTDTFEVQHHEHGHTGEKCHMCEVCGKYMLYEVVSECPYAWPYWWETIQLQHLWSSLHLQVSIEKYNFIPVVVRAFNCVHCDTSFLTYIWLYNHVQLHTCPFKCEGCSRVFTAYVIYTQKHTDTWEELQWRVIGVEVIPYWGLLRHTLANGALVYPSHSGRYHAEGCMAMG